ncbi:MAG: sensor histidine kinase [Ferrimicrobium sp.]
MSETMHPDREALYEAAFSRLATGVVIADETGDTVYSDYLDKFGGSLLSQRVLLERAVASLQRDARNGTVRETSLDLFGPPRTYYRLQSAPLASDHIPPYVITVNDATQQHYLEEVRRDFVANVSHELKTPVGAIVILADAMSNEDDPKTLLRLSRRILGEGDRLARLIGDLLDLSRIEESPTHTTANLNITELLRDCCNTARDLATEKGITITDTAPDKPIWIPAERWQLRSAFSNLLDNAVKYSDPGASVSVSITQEQSFIRVEIVDQGIGIPARDLNRIFERFYRIDADRSRATGGTGLGLSIVRHVIDNHRGTVEVTSTEGVGSTFTVRLPQLNPQVLNTVR